MLSQIPGIIGGSKSWIEKYGVYKRLRSNSYILWNTSTLHKSSFIQMISSIPCAYKTMFKGSEKSHETFTLSEVTNDQQLPPFSRSIFQCLDAIYNLQEGMAYDLIVLTTNIVNGHTLIDTFVEKLGWLLKIYFLIFAKKTMEETGSEAFCCRLLRSRLVILFMRELSYNDHCVVCGLANKSEFLWVLDV